MKKNSSDELKAREIALKILTEHERRNAYINLLLDGHLSRVDLNRQERAYITELVLGTIRMKKTLDFAIEAFMDRKINRISREVAWLLRIGVYQSLFMKVPDYAVCDTSVRIARLQCDKRTAAFVNGVLRSFCRGKDNINWPDPAEDPVKAIAIKESHPEWIVRMWLDELGMEKTRNLCEANNRTKAVSVRVNTLRTTVEDCENLLRNHGILTQRSLLVPEGLLLRRTGTISDLQEFKNGLFAIQDEASMLVVYALEPGEGMRVIDICAAPGGKTTHVAQMMRNHGRVLALDINKSRLENVKTLARRLGIEIIETKVMDSRLAPDIVREKFDRVLVDVPCSGLGTLARKPDVRWRKKAEDIERLSALQLELLFSASELLRDNGVLVYSACTISRRESKDVISRFLNFSRGFELEEIELPGGLKLERGQIQIFPDVHGCDGMYIARLRKTG